MERFSGKSKDVKESHPSVIFPYWIFLSRSLLLPTHFGPSPTWNRSWTQEGQEGIIVGFEVTEHGLAAYTSWSKLKGKRTGPFFFFQLIFLNTSITLEINTKIIKIWILTSEEKSQSRPCTALGLVLPILCKKESPHDSMCLRLSVWGQQSSQLHKYICLGSSTHVSLPRSTEISVAILCS